MVKRYMLIAAIALSSMQASFAAPWANFFRSAATKIKTSNGFQAASNQWRSAKAHMKDAIAKNSQLTFCVNKGSEIAKNIIKRSKDIVDDWNKLDPKKKFLATPWIGLLALSITGLRIGISYEDREKFIKLPVEQNQDLKKALNECLDIYAQNDKDIIFCKDDSSFDSVFANSTLKAIFLGEEMVQSLSVPCHGINTQCMKDRRRAQVIVGHEIGHIMHGHLAKGIYFHNALNAITALGITVFLAACKRRNIIYAVPAAVIGKYYGDSMLIAAYSRHREREADGYAIAHTRDPKNLRALSELYKAETSYQPKNILEYYIKYTHPLDSERAEYFQKAAECLEKKYRGKSGKELETYIKKTTMIKRNERIPFVQKVQDDNAMWEKAICAKHNA